MFRKMSIAINIEELRTNYKNQDVNMKSIHNCSTHTIYLQLLVETGIIGAIPIVLLTIFIIYF